MSLEAAVSEDVILDTILWTTLIVGIWYWRRERAAITALLKDTGVDVDALTAGEEEPTPSSALEADVEIPSLRVLATERGDLRLEADVRLQDRAGEAALLKLGILRQNGTPFAHPAAAGWTRFGDGLETLGGDRRTRPAARSYAFWHDLAVEVRRGDVPLPDGPTTFQLRAEVWLDGRREASSRVSQRFELGSRGAPEPTGDPCIACERPGADVHCPRCRAPHHSACLRRNRGCTDMACAARLEAGDDPYRGAGPAP